MIIEGIRLPDGKAPLTTSTFTMAFTVENLASAVRVSDVVLSPDATKLVYRTSPTLKNAGST